MTGLTPNFEYVRSVVKNAAGISLDKGKDYLIENRLAPVASKHGFDSIPDLVQEMMDEGEGGTIERIVIDALTINETSFFRDQAVFDHLEQTVLPQIIKKNAGTKRLKIWSAACSTGQEIYSTAILLKERFPRLKDWHIGLHATDISDRVLEQARSGTYSEFELNRGISPALKEKYFNKVSEFDWQICEEIRQSVSFSRHNLVGAWNGLGMYDVILLRNVLIYFELPEKQLILSHARKHINEGGHLFLGASETTFNIDSNWVSEGTTSASFQVKGKEVRNIGI
ncbi:CheR family methyltransferase [Pelagicoccus mobilis]|uniref:protein-glutamate O-methyltransferase n=1 Tax=Pelagicoccus mobilis TaxID=415221 RepID=A0A934VRS7_9BACT|nr:protein-glutamate O-methyltransferase CheR [Pelagicoccus mobilis]MBK1878270.1 protein-glutamate O-methyltransferase CheR [Pelagicoccus mobilis]